MNKTQLYAAVTDKLEAIYSTNKITKKAQAEINELMDAYLKPKTGGARTSENPPKLDADGIITEAYCKYYKRYFPSEEMNISFRGEKGKEKSRGESLLGAQRYREITKNINDLKQKAQDLILEGDIKGAQEAAAKAKELFDNRTDPKMYDYDRDVTTLKHNEEEA